MTAAALSSPPAGRRDRNMREKRRRIFDAATALFDERGYHAVTTQEVSERADIAVGTLFRYAATKNELLLLIYNEKLRHALERGAERARHSDDLGLTPWGGPVSVLVHDGLLGHRLGR